MKELILASSSASRREGLTKIGIPFRVVPSNYEEDMSLELAPRDLAIYLSQGKAREVAGRVKNAVVLGADSFAYLGTELLGKPHTLEKAREMLKKLSGAKHMFVTGYTIIDADTGEEFSDAVETEVYFRKLSDKEINHYIEKDQPLVNAGAYKLQSLGAVLVDKIVGNYDNVLGMPIGLIAKHLEDFGIEVL